MADTFSSELFGSFRQAQGDMLSRALAIADENLRQTQAEHQKRMDEIREQHQQAQEDYWKQQEKIRTEQTKATTQRYKDMAWNTAMQMGLRALPQGVPYAAAFGSAQRIDPQATEDFLKQLYGGFKTGEEAKRAATPPAPQETPPEGTGVPPSPQFMPPAIQGQMPSPLPSTPSVPPNIGTMLGGSMGAGIPTQTPAPMPQMTTQPAAFGGMLAEPTSQAGAIPPPQPQIPSYQQWLASPDPTFAEKMRAQLENQRATAQARQLQADAAMLRAQSDEFQKKINTPAYQQILQDRNDLQERRVKVEEAKLKPQLEHMAAQTAYLVTQNKLKPQEVQSLIKFRQISGQARMMSAQTGRKTAEWRMKNVANTKEAQAIWRQWNTAALGAEKEADRLERELANAKTDLDAATNDADTYTQAAAAAEKPADKVIYGGMQKNALGKKISLQQRIGDETQGLIAAAKQARETAKSYRNLTSQMASQLEKGGLRTYTGKGGSGPVPKGATLSKTGSATDITDILSERYTIRK